GTLTLLNSTITNTPAATISAVIDGTTPWAKEGAGQLTLSGATSNTATGLLSVNAGRLHLSKTGGATALAGDVTISTGGTVTFSGGTNQIAPTANVILNGAASGFNGTGPNANTGSVTQTLATLTVSGGSFNSGSNGVWNIGAVRYVAGENKTFVGNSGSHQTYGSLSLAGMNGANSSTAVANGFTIFGNGSPSTNRTSLTVGSGGLYLEDSRIHLNGGTSGSVLVLDGDVSTGGTATSYITRIAGGALQPFIHLSSTAGAVARTFDVAAGGANLDIAPIIADGEATSGAIIKEGAGILLFTGTEANTFTGGVTINAGTLRLNKTAGVTAVSSDIVVNTGGILQLSTSNQIADTASITLNGGTITAWSTDETIAALTQNAGGLTSSGNTGHVTVVGALTLAGGNILVINSNAGSSNPASWNVGSAVLSGADILIGGSNGVGNPRTTLTIGSGGLTMLGRTLTMNVGDAGVQLNLNGDFTGAGSNNIVTNSTASQQPLLEIGAATRTFNVLSGTTNVGVIISGTGGNLVKTASGLLQLTNSSTYSGSTTVAGGTISVISSGALPNTSEIIVDNGGIFQNGNSSAAGNNGVSNRVNTAAPLTMGGGTFNQMTAASGSHTQDLTRVTITAGANTVNATATPGTTVTLNFTDPTPYIHSGGSVNFVQNPVDGGSINFAFAPSGAGNVSGGVLIGATLNSSDLIVAQSGVLTAYTGWIPTGTSTWTNGGNMDVTDSNPVPFASETINALRFNTAGALTITLTGTHTIDAGMLLTTPNVGANLSTLTGGQIQGPAGGDLILSQFNTAGNLTIGSGIIDNTSASGLIKTGSGIVELTGTNSYSGTTLVNLGVLRAADGVGLPSTSRLVLDGGTFQSLTASFTRALGSSPNQVAVIGGTSGFSAASTALAVNLGGAGAQVQWGSSFFDPSVLLLNASSATASLDFQNALDLNASNRTVRVDANTATLSGVISGSGAGLVKTGSGVLRLTQANTFDGGTTISSGTVAIGDNGALGTGPITMSGGALQADGAARTLANDFSFTSSSTLTGSNPATLTLTGVISGSGTVNKTGSAVVELAGNNLYTGTTSVTNGILRLLSNTALGTTGGGTSVSGASHVELADGVVITGETITISTTTGGSGAGSLTVNRGGLQAAVNATAEWAGDVIIGANQGRIGVQEGGKLTISGDITDGANSFDVRLSGELTGTGGLYLAGTGNAWDGQTEIVRGKVFLGVNDALPTGTILDIHFTGSNSTEYAGLDLNGYNQTIGSLRNEGNTPNFAEVTNSSCVPSTLTVNETGAITYGAMINGNLALVKNGAGTLSLTRANLFKGGTTINEGTLQVANSTALGTGGLAVNGGTTSAGKLDLNNTSLVIDALNGTSGALSAIIANDSATAATRTLTLGAQHGSGDYAGQIVNNTGGAAAGLVALTKIGTGSQTLSGSNSYSGDTTLSNGTLIADYTGSSPLSASSLIKMQGGTLVITNATSAAIGAITQVQGGADFTTGAIRIEDGATVTVGTFTGVGYTPFLIDLTGGGTLVATTLSGMGNTNGVLLGTNNNRATTFVQDDSGFGFATYNGSSELVRYTTATTLTASNSSSATNFIATADVLRTASLSFHTLQVDTSTNSITLDLGSGNLAVGGTGRSVLVSGTHDATITSTTGAVTGGSFYISNYSTGQATLDLSLAGQTVIASGPGLIEYTRTSNPADLYVAGCVFRMTGGTRDYSNNLVRIYGGGV
ncbi:MAG: autotransporter-associated beta strand repeat-containing protein, partial [Verrucomicrobiales bacterium]|nr:autotransporter-associated beta strand repeat-containing protein [Verrucomicrobiales bacterium]